MKKQILPIFIAITLALLAFQAKSFLSAVKARHTLTYQQYIKNKYPLISGKVDYKKLFDSLDYYTYPNPEVTTAKVPTANAEKLAPGKLVCQPYVTPCGNVPGGYYFRNLYLLNHLSASKYFTGFPSDSYVEVSHNGWYDEPGIYYYFAKGSGVYLNLGKTLIAKDKLDAMHKLGLSNMYIFKHSDVSYYNHGRFGASIIGDVNTQAIKAHMSLKKYINYLYNVKREENNYQLSYISEQPSYDNLIYLNAKKQGYDTVQLTAQRNGNDGWDYEILDVRPAYLATIKTKWQHEQKYLSMRNPLNLKQAKPCKLKIPFTDGLVCQGQS